MTEHNIEYRGFKVPDEYLNPAMFTGGLLSAWRLGVDTVLDTRGPIVVVHDAQLGSVTKAPPAPDGAGRGYVYYVTDREDPNMVWRFPWGSPGTASGEVRHRDPGGRWTPAVSRRADFRDTAGFLLDEYRRVNEPPEWARD